MKDGKWRLRFRRVVVLLLLAQLYGRRSPLGWRQARITAI
jgi:hypothetical protein